jgi:beta-galactosidase
LHGGDYNPEQWSEDVWASDAEMMREASVNSVTLGVFSWVNLEPEEGRYTFDWLDKIMDIQARDGRTVGLATPTAAVPGWLSQKYPEVLRKTPTGDRRKHGNRVNMCWSSPVFQEKSLEIGSKLAERYGSHPALAFWHISNEYGGHCYCELCEQKFREWLQIRYGTLDSVNTAYWAKFWSHTYTDWNQITIPGEPIGETSVHGLTMDWKRFSSQQIIDFYKLERDNLKSFTPDVPCTTNLMGTYDVVDGFAIAKEMDFVSWDSYPWFTNRPYDVTGWIQASFLHDLNRSMKQGKPFLLMECAPSASNWYSVMHLKRPGQHTLEGLQAVAHGADGVQYFQWRQSSGSMEQYHGAVVAHNDRREARVFQDVVSLGGTLQRLDGVIGAPVPSQVAVIYDWEVDWSIQTGLGYRSQRPQYGRTVLEHYKALFELNIETDVIDSVSDFSSYKLVVAPMLYMLRPGVADSLAQFVRDGGTLVLTYLSAWVDEDSQAFRGGYPEPLRSALGIWSEELDELYPDQQNRVQWNDGIFATSDYSELIHLSGAEALGSYADDFYSGRAAVTRNQYGKGAAYYVASRNEASFTRSLLGQITQELGIFAPVSAQVPEGVSLRRRVGAEGDFVFVLNYNSKPAHVDLETESLLDAETRESIGSVVELPPFGSRVFVRPLVGSRVELR